MSLRTLGTLLVGLLLGGCVATATPLSAPQTVGQVDLPRYQGTWYELARLPMFFQRNCAQSEAHYALRDDGTLALRNRCQTLQGEWQEASGQAFAQQAGQTDKLWVRFDNWFSRLFPNLTRGDYWVLYLDDDYHVALVGNPDRQYLWLLSRTPQVPTKTREQLLSIARERGYATEGLIWRVADSSIAQP